MLSKLVKSRNGRTARGTQRAETFEPLLEAHRGVSVAQVGV